MECLVRSPQSPVARVRGSAGLRLRFRCGFVTMATFEYVLNLPDYSTERGRRPLPAADPRVAKSRNDAKIGVPGRARTCDPRFHTTSAFAAARHAGRSWPGLSLHRGSRASAGPLGAARLVSTPSWRPCGPGLARDRQGATGAPEAFPEFERIRRVVSRRGAQFLSLGNLCSVQLSYG